MYEANADAFDDTAEDLAVAGLTRAHPDATATLMLTADLADALWDLPDRWELLDDPSRGTTLSYRIDTDRARRAHYFSNLALQQLRETPAGNRGKLLSLHLANVAALLADA